jgi:hypothetical protein
MISLKTLQSTLLAISAASCLLAISFAQSGTSKPTDASIVSAPKSIKVEITTGIEKYSPIMSSVPGMPLNAVVSGVEDTTKLKYRWQAQDGALSLWQSPDFKVKNQGKIALTNSGTVYWQLPTLTQPQNPYTVQISLEVLDEKNQAIGNAGIVLDIDSKLMVTVKKQR